MAGEYSVSQPVPRTEDPRLLTGRGNYVSDVSFPDQVHGYTVRSPHAHARLVALDIAAAEQAPGVLKVYTHADVMRAGLGHTKPHFPARKRPKDGSPEY